MKSYSWLALRGQLRTGILIAGVVVGVGVARVGVGQDLGSFFGAAAGPVVGRLLNPSPAKPAVPAKATSAKSENPKAQEAATDQAGTKSAHGSEMESEGKDKKDDETQEKAKPEDLERIEAEFKRTLLESSMEPVKGTTVDGKQLYKAIGADGKTYEFYQVTGDPKSNYISMKDGDGFRWTTKNEMLGLKNTGPGGLTETGSLDIGNGRVTSMFQDGAGNRYYSTGEGGSWFKETGPGKNSFVANKELTMGASPTQDIFENLQKTQIFQPNAVQPSIFTDSPSVRRGATQPLTGGGGSSGGASSAATTNGPLLAQGGTSKDFLKRGPYAAQNPAYRAKIDKLTQSQADALVEEFKRAPRGSQYANCPSCYFGAGGGQGVFNKTINSPDSGDLSWSPMVSSGGVCTVGPDGEPICN